MVFPLREATIYVKKPKYLFARKRKSGKTQHIGRNFSIATTYRFTDEFTTNKQNVRLVFGCYIWAHSILPVYDGIIPEMSC